MKLSGAAVTVTGVVVLIMLRPSGSGNSGVTAGENLPIGGLLLLASVASYLFAMFLQKRIDAHIPSFVITVSMFFVGAISNPIVLAVDLLFVRPGRNLIQMLANISLAGWLAMGYAVFVASCSGYLLFVYTLKLTSPLYSSIFAPLVPLLTALLAWAMFGSVPLPTDLIGGGLIILGLVLVVWGKARELAARDRYCRTEMELEGTELRSVVMQDASTNTEEEWAPDTTLQHVRVEKKEEDAALLESAASATAEKNADTVA